MSSTSTTQKFLSRISSLNPFSRQPRPRDLQLRLDTNRIYATFGPSRHQQSPPFPHIARSVRYFLHSSAVHQLSHLHTALRNPSQLHFVLIRSLGFSLCVAASKIPNAGRGVFVKGGSIKRGTLVTLYPGVSYLPSDVRKLSNVNDYFISRYDGVVLDGAADLQLEIEPVDETLADTELEHPFALGHLVNHPPPSTTPNVLQFMLDLEVPRVPQRARPLIPVSNFDSSTSVMERMENIAYRQRVPTAALFLGKGEVRRTVALVAMDDLKEGDELYMDYRFSPKNTNIPAWYHPCDLEENERRWYEASMHI
eukprot:GFKZ01013697.1.p1 GENE.GFKZ01013697.1~~GFKZ01013697.1.p1  ORF type:complete len:310 (+),score=28.51 GFKZ01013697.1:56-985(+)